MQHTIKVFEHKPIDFDEKVQVAAAYIEIDSKLLLLQLAENKENAKRWSVPAGKLEVGETPENALRRELFEETGIYLPEEISVDTLGHLFIRKPGIDYVYHAFKVHLKSRPKISLSNEHTAYCWVSVDEARKLPLIDGAEDALHFYLKSIGKKRTCISAH